MTEKDFGQLFVIGNGSGLMNLYGNKVNLIFLYSKKISRIKREQQSAVSKLLQKYGKTLDNKDHGKNLMHKFILKGRLKIQEIVLFGN